MNSLFEAPRRRQIDGALRQADGRAGGAGPGAGRYRGRDRDDERGAGRRRDRLHPAPHARAGAGAPRASRRLRERRNVSCPWRVDPTRRLVGCHCGLVEGPRGGSGRGPVGGRSRPKRLGQFGWWTGSRRCSPRCATSPRSKSAVPRRGVAVRLAGCPQAPARRRDDGLALRSGCARRSPCSTAAASRQPVEPALEDDFDRSSRRGTRLCPWTTSTRTSVSGQLGRSGVGLAEPASCRAACWSPPSKCRSRISSCCRGQPAQLAGVPRAVSGPTRLPEPEPEPEPEEQQGPTTAPSTRADRDPLEILGKDALRPRHDAGRRAAMLMADPKFNSKLPARWVFVRRAPVGTKAEAKWRVAETVPNAVIRDKSRPLGDGGPGPAASPGPQASPGGLMPVSSIHPGRAEAGPRKTAAIAMAARCPSQSRRARHDARRCVRGRGPCCRRDDAGRQAGGGKDGGVADVLCAVAKTCTSCRR